MLRELCHRHQVTIHMALLAATAFALFSNNYRHSYPLDSGHLLLDNSYVRSLRHIPTYFIDPGTLTINRANVDYRPILQITYALNYWISGYDTWSWHLVQVLLHISCVLGIYWLCRRLVGEFHGSDAPMVKTSIPFIAALLFCVHPTTSGVVNYLSARSSLLTAALVLFSLLLYMRPVQKSAAGRAPWGAAALYALSLFTKVEAVAALAVCFLWDVLQTARLRAQSGGKPRLLKDLSSTVSRATIGRLWPFLLITAVYALTRSKVMAGYNLSESSHGSDVTGLVYFYTQVTAWWHYVLTWFAPVNLVADDLTYPVFRTPFAPEVLLAAAGWLLVAAMLALLYRRLPYLLFLAVSALALISPTSSILPLSEMVNEHRPYLPLAMLSLVWLIPTLRFALTAENRRIAGQGPVYAGIGLLLLSFSVLTYQRNRVFSTDESYYGDIVKKAPSSRAYVNYGLTFLRKGNYDEAFKYFQLALERDPNWHIVHINLAVVYRHQGKDDLAIYHFNRAVEAEQYSGISLVHRGEYFLGKGDFAAALQDYERSIPLHREFYRIYKGMATAYAGLGQWDKSLEYTRKCIDIDPRQTELDVVNISRPYWTVPALFDPGIRYYQEVDHLFPNRWWVHWNIGDLAAKLGRSDLAARENEKAKILRK